MHIRKKETLYETNQMFAISAYRENVSYRGSRCVEFVYFLRGEAFLGNCLAALTFWFFCVKAKERQFFVFIKKCFGKFLYREGFFYIV